LPDTPKHPGAGRAQPGRIFVLPEVTEDNSQPLSNTHLFEGLPERITARLAAAAVRKVCRKGERVFLQGGKGDWLYCVASGRVRIDAIGFAGQEVFLNEMNPGDCFGEIAVVDGKGRTAGATATEPTVLWAIHRHEVLWALDEHPELRSRLFDLICYRMRWSTDLYQDAAFLTPSARLAKRVLHLALYQDRPAGGAIELRIKQSDLARFLGVSRKLVNDHLNDWKERSWVSVARGRLYIRDVDALRSLAAGRNDTHKIAR
jgi:CRP-like cAMP-binding protein